MVTKIVPPHDAWSTIVINGAMYSLDATLPIGRLTKFLYSIITKDPWIEKAALIEESCWFVGQRGRRHGADACAQCCASIDVDVSFEGKLLSLLFFGFSGRYFLVSRNLEGPS